MIRTIAGNLAADPEVVKAGKAFVTKFTVLENTGEFRDGKWQKHDTPTEHNIEAWFELGQAAAATFKKGHGVIVIGHERTDSWTKDDGTKGRKRAMEATTIGATLSARQSLTVVRAPREDAAPAAETPAPAPSSDWAAPEA